MVHAIDRCFCVNLTKRQCGTLSKDTVSRELFRSHLRSQKWFLANRTQTGSGQTSRPRSKRKRCDSISGSAILMARWTISSSLGSAALLAGIRSRRGGRHVVYAARRNFALRYRSRDACVNHAAQQIVGRERNQRTCYRQLVRNVVVARRVNSTVMRFFLNVSVLFSGAKHSSLNEP